jgi:hypothetical protein
MIKFVENETSIKEFVSEYEVKSSIIFPIFQNRIEHPIKNRLLGVIVFVGKTTYVLMEIHNDVLPISLSVLENSITTKWVFDTKWFLHRVNLINTKSVDVSYHLSELKTYDYTSLYHSLTQFYKTQNDLSFIPITKIVEKVSDFVKDNLRYVNDGASGFDKYNDLVLPTFNSIEKNGIPTKFGKEYSLYNNFTITGRPTNNFGGVNYSALNKSDGSRDHIVSELGEFYQYDYDGYHIRLIGKLIGEDIPTTSAHEWLGKQYFGKDELTEEDYQVSKAITFRQLYGGIDTHNLSIPFYDKTNQFIKTLYNDFLVKGYIQTRFGKRIPFQRIENHNPQKVFNYYLQALETETNVMILNRINQLLDGKNTKMVLYVYDSFLFDVDESETSLLPQIESILHLVAPTKVSKNSIYGKI